MILHMSDEFTSGRRSGLRPHDAVPGSRVRVPSFPLASKTCDLPSNTSPLTLTDSLRPPEPCSARACDRDRRRPDQHRGSRGRPCATVTGDGAGEETPRAVAEKLQAAAAEAQRVALPAPAQASAAEELCFSAKHCARPARACGRRESGVAITERCGLCVSHAFALSPACAALRQPKRA
jgi:hypothetical protein